MRIGPRREGRSPSAGPGNCLLVGSHSGTLVPTHGAVGGQAGVADLIEQRAVADAEGAGRLLAVPVMCLQDLEDDLTFEFARGLAGKFLERDRPVEIDFRIEVV